MEELEQPQVSNDAAEAQSTHKGGWITSPFILVSMFGVTVAFNGAINNMIIYLIKECNVKSIDAAQIGNIISGCISLAPVAGGIVSDAFFGCYPGVIFSVIASLLSVILFTLTAAVRSLRPSPCPLGSDACELSSAGQLALLYVAVAMMAVGVGGARFNMIAMGAAQFGKVRDQSTFFNWYFIFHYGDAIVGSTVIFFVEDSVSWTLGFGLCAATNAVSLVVLFIGARYYRRPGAEGSPFTGLARVVVATTKKWNVEVPQENPGYYYGAGGSDQKPHHVAPSQSLWFLNRAALICHGETRADGSLAKPWSLCTVQQVEDFKSLLRIAPLLSASVFVSVSIGMQLSLTVLQALTMDRSIGRHFSILAASFMVAFLAAAVVALSLLDRLLLPLWQRLTLGRTPTPLQRIGLGHVLNAAAIAASALVERRRAAVVSSHHAESRAAWAVPMSALWLVLPMAVTGVGVAVHFPGHVALYYQEFPSSLKNTATAMIAVNIGLGFYLSTAIVDLIRRSTGWLPDNINASKLENVYWLLTVLALVNLVNYLVCAMLYKYQGAPEPEEAYGHHGH